MPYWLVTRSNELSSNGSASAETPEWKCRAWRHGAGCDDTHAGATWARSMALMRGMPAARPAQCVQASCGISSEEPTSELQSLMRISYAVLCLQKTTKRTSTRQKDPPC